MEIKIYIAGSPTNHESSINDTTAAEVERLNILLEKGKK